MRFPEDGCTCDHSADDHAMTARAECVVEGCDCPGFEMSDDQEREADEAWLI